MSDPTADSVIDDPLDLGIIRALQTAPRVPFRVLGEILGCSEQTVARRFRRMQRDGVVRVTAVVNPSALGQSNWLVRVQVRPDGAESLARALGQRDDVSWVTLLSGGSEVSCVVRSRTRRAREELLIQKLPRTAQVLGLRMSVVLHRFAGGPLTDDWTGIASVLDAAQYAALEAHRPPLPADGGVVTLDAADTALLDQLVRDGRSPYSALAAAAGISEGRAARRLDALLRDGVAYLDVDLSGPSLGFRAGAALWLTVAPGALAAAGEALSRASEVAFVAAVSGTHNLAVTVVCRDLESLYRFITEVVGPIEGVQTLEVTPMLRTVKHAGTQGSGDRLAN